MADEVRIEFKPCVLAECTREPLSKLASRAHSSGEAGEQIRPLRARESRAILREIHSEQLGGFRRQLPLDRALVLDLFTRHMEVADAFEVWACPTKVPLDLHLA
jgi:hypothetical protein